MAMDLQAALKAAADGDGNVRAKIIEMTGKYDNPVHDEEDMASKLPYASLPQGSDPSPFVIGQTGKK
jgi:type III secretion system FlhB-like substrate exporter